MGNETCRLQKDFDEAFRKMAASPTWAALCQQVFDRYVGQLSFTSLAQIHCLAMEANIGAQSCVLELAPGNGGLSLYLAKLTGCHLIGLDASPLAVDMANRRAAAEGLADFVCFQVGILPVLPFPEDSFDVVVSIDSVYLVADKNALFCECMRVLRPDGRLAFYTIYRLKELPRERTRSWPPTTFPPQSYPKLLKKVGFTDISMIDVTAEFARLTKQWVHAIQEQKESLWKELGEKFTQEILADIETSRVMASEGYVGRAFFKAKKPIARATKTNFKAPRAQSHT